jgi:hypothetical protein
VEKIKEHYNNSTACDKSLLTAKHFRRVFADSTTCANRLFYSKKLSFFKKKKLNLKNVVTDYLQVLKKNRRAFFQTRDLFFAAKLLLHGLQFKNELMRRYKSYIFQINYDNHTNERPLVLTASSEIIDYFKVFNLKKLKSLRSSYEQLSVFKSVTGLNLCASADNFFLVNLTSFKAANSLAFFQLTHHSYLSLVEVFENFINTNDTTAFYHTNNLLPINTFNLKAFSKSFEKTASCSTSFKSTSFLFKKTPNILFNNFAMLGASFETFLFYFYKPLFFKCFINNSRLSFNYFYQKISYQANKLLFYSKKSYFFKSNLLPNPRFSYVFKRKLLKMFSYQKFPIGPTPFYNNSIVRFLEHCTGKKVALRITPLLTNVLSFVEKAQCFS